MNDDESSDDEWLQFSPDFSLIFAGTAGFPWEANNSEREDPSGCEQQQKQKQCKTTKTSVETWEEIL